MTIITISTRVDGEPIRATLTPSDEHWLATVVNERTGQDCYVPFLPMNAAVESVEQIVRDLGMVAPAVEPQ